MKIAFSDYTLGAAVATGLVNTDPLVRSSGEALGDPAALRRFLAEHEVHPDALTAEDTPTDDDLHQVLVLRQQVRAILESSTEEHIAEGANALARRAGMGPALYRDTDGRWQWYVTTSPQASLADELAALAGLGLLGVLRTLSLERFRHCSSPTCNGMFVDTSRAGRRRYCMPDVCGNRLNVANHRARQRAAEPDAAHDRDLT